MRRVPFGSVAVLAVVLAACAGDAPSTADVLGHVVDDAMVPMLEEAASSIEALSSEVAAFCEVIGPPEGVQSSWAETQEAWERAEVMTLFGPAQMLRTLSMVDYRPVSEDGITELVESTTPIDPDYVENRAASTQRGLGAIEFVMYGEINQRACALGEASASVASDHARRLEAAWVTSNDGGPAFRDELVDTMSPEESLAEIVGAIVEIFRRQSSRELGVALGLSASDADPSQLPEGRAGLGADTYLAQVAGVEEILEAGGGASLMELIRSRAPDVATEIEANLEAMTEALLEIDGPLIPLVEEDPAQLEAVYDLASRLHVLFEADVVSALDLTLGFSDTDGDSGSGG